MPTITHALLDAAFLGFNTKFRQVYKDTPVRWDKFASLMESDSAEERYAWLKRQTELREWIGDRVIDNLSTNLQAIVNKKYEKTFGVEREKLEDDKIGVFTPSVEDLARGAKIWPDRITTDALRNGGTAIAHDGQYFFDVDHPINPDKPSGSTQANLFTTTALTHDNVATVRAAMKSFKSEDGVSLELEPKTLIVPPQLETKALQIANAEIIAPTGGFGVNAAQAQTNVLKGTLDVVVLPRLDADATTWYLADTSRAIKPIVFQRRIEPEFEYLNKPGDPNVFIQDKYLYGVRARGAAGYGPYFLISKCVG